MNKLAIINSFHSDSVETLAEYSPKAVVCFDSHLDDHIGGGPETAKILNKLTVVDRGALLRASAHARLRLLLPKSAIHLVIPKTCFQHHISGMLSAVEGAKANTSLEGVVSFKRTWLEALRINLFLCPPNNIRNLFTELRKHDTAIDIDVDYMTEFQEICYTRAPGVEVEGIDGTSLGSMNTVVNVVHRLRPEIITISEVRLPYIDAPESPFMILLKYLENTGFQIEMGEIVDNDHQAIKAIEKETNFHKEMLLSTKKRPTGGKASIEEFKRADKELAAALRKHYLQ